jgi:flavodoxin/NAD-dependent dihydropyrimidine dehydrogenase PreA subunit
MKVTIFYFSQTGNTRKVACAMNEEFKKAGCNTTCLSINEVKPEHFINNDIIGIGTPTFESHAPTPIKDFIKSLPMLSGQRFFVFATCGGASGNVLSDLTKLLKRKGSEIIDNFLAIGEIHHPAPCIVGKSQDRPNEEDLNSARRFAFTISQRISSTSEMQYNGLKPKKRFYNLVGKIASSEKLIRLLEPRPKLDQNKCKQCENCVHECPMDNIAMNPGPVINNKCIRCYRCVNICKNKAYSVNWWLGNLVVFLLWNKFFMHWFGEYNREK